MIRKWWFRLYILCLITAAIVIIVPLLPLPKKVTVSPVAAPVESLGFYSNVPLETRLRVSSWLSSNRVSDQTKDNVTVRQGTLRDNTYRLGTQLQREISLVMNIKRSQIDFTVLVTIDPSGKVAPLTSIGCVEGDSSPETANCKELLRA